MALLASRSRRRFAIALWAAFIEEVLRRLLDLQWRLTHAEFETGDDQLQAYLADVARNRGVARFEGHPNTRASGLGRESDSEKLQIFSRAQG